MESTGVGPASFVEDGGAGAAGLIFDVSVGRERCGPGDIAVAGEVVVVAAFAEEPFGAGEILAQRKEVGRDVGVVFGEMFFGAGELIHEGEAQVLLFCGEVYLGEFVRVLLGSFPTDLTSEAGFVACRLEAREFFEEEEEDGFDEVPVFGATGEESTKPEVIGAGFVDVDGTEVALAGGGNIKSQAELRI